MNTTLKLAVVTASMLAAVVACGRAAKSDTKPGQTETSSARQVVGAKPASIASCNLEAETGTCTEYKARTSFGLEKSLCDSAKGRFALGPCPEASRIGACTMSDGEVKRYYDANGHGMSADEAKADCEGSPSKGVFVAAD